MRDKISGKSAMALVIANMIGTGVFTSLGFQLQGTTNTYSIILLWIFGAVMAISGAFTYAELGTKLTRSGGEYYFLSKTYSPFIGYLSGWTSLTVGFSAAIALAAMAAGAYTQKYLGINDKLIASILIIGISIIHTTDLKKSSQFQNATSLTKVILIVLFISVGFYTDSPNQAFDWSSGWTKEIALPSFAVSLVYVSYSFSGWNAAAYIVDEIKNVNKNLPIALIGGTLLVSVLYLLLQLVFLKQSSLSQLSGQVEIGQIVAENIFGSFGGKLISGAIAFMLISSISAMVWVGPRVTKTMGDDYKLWQFLSKTNSKNIPNRAIGFQVCIALLMVFTGSFDQILTYSAFILQLFVSLTIFSLFLVRKNQSLQGYKSPLFPLPQLIFLGISLWIMIYLLIEQPKESFIGLGILVLGGFTYLLNQWNSKKNKTLKPDHFKPDSNQNMRTFESK